MKATFTFIACICFYLYSTAQNLVLNPGLENYITCPGFGQFSNTYINDWDKPNYGSTDYYHYNCPGIIPTQQVPHGGDAYAGIIGYNYGAEYREYMTGTLSVPLIPGATYYCEFYVSLNDGYIQAIKELGAYFSATPPGPYANALHVPVTPQIVNTATLLDDTSAWMKISGYFLAVGGEQYITIGNFYTDTNTTVVQVGNVGSYGSYYFVDDVWVSLSEGTGLDETENAGVQFYPNPVLNKLTLLLDNERISRMQQQREISSIKFFTVFGKEVLNMNYLKQGIQEIDLSMLPPGIYFAEIDAVGKSVRRKIIRQ